MIWNSIKKSTMKYHGNFRGKVEDDNDPLKLGRVKVRIHPIMNNAKITTEMLPWAVPALPMMGGAGEAGAYGFFAVPRINAEVWVFFEMGDPAQPVYFAEAGNAKHGMVTEKDTAYPKAIVWNTKNGMKFYLDDHILRITHADGHIVLINANDIKITHKSGTYVLIDVDGNVLVDSVGGITAKGKSIHLDTPVVTTSHSLEVGDAASGTFLSADGKQITVKAGITTAIV